MNEKQILSQRAAYKLMLTDYPDVMTLQQVSEVLGVCKKSCTKLMGEGKLKYLKIGRSYRIPKSYLLSYLLSANLRQ